MLRQWSILFVILPVSKTMPIFSLRLLDWNRLLVSVMLCSMQRLFFPLRLNLLLKLTLLALLNTYPMLILLMILPHLAYVLARQTTVMNLIFVLLNAILASMTALPFPCLSVQEEPGGARAQGNPGAPKGTQGEPGGTQEEPEGAGSKREAG